MIAARKEPLLDELFYRAYLRPSLRRHFHTIRIRGMGHLRGLPAGRSVIAFANHTNWWDGLIIFFLTRFVPERQFFCMMEEKQLRHYRFFTRLGAFSVDPGNSLRAAGAVFYSLKLLKRPDTMLWIFPQGKMVGSQDPVEIRPGAGFIGQRSNQSLMIPVAFRYAFFREQRPEVLIAVGEPHTAAEVSEAWIQQSLQQLADELRESESSGDLSGFEPLMNPGWSVNKVWEAVIHFLRGRWHEFKPVN
ncbi:MAG: lysophospholipid acyltransferase family protein [Candidatus Methylacidiphilales bacterium]|nr:lysophospholipid acyltransferase family protein [Candidatus Methylacidiphilales bacterium]